MRTPRRPTLTRRQFTQGAVGLVASASLPWTSGRAADASSGYVDVHTHLTQRWGKKEGLGPKPLLDWMDRRGVESAVVLPLVSPEAWRYPVSTDFVLRATRPHRDRLIPFCAIDPRTINLGGVDGMVDLLKQYVDAGAQGFGEHKPGVAIDDDRNLRVFEACTKVGLPVLFHLDNHRNFDEPGLPGLENVLKRFPETPFIGHAQGWWASISGDVKQTEMQGYPSGAVAPGGAVDRLMSDYDNIFGDLSAGSGANALQRDLSFARSFVRRRADRLLFGTDYLQPGQSIPQFKLIRETLDLPPEVERKITRENAAALLGLRA